MLKVPSATHLVSQEVHRYLRDHYDHPFAAWDQPRSSDLGWEVTGGHVVAVAAAARAEVHCGGSGMKSGLEDNLVLEKLGRKACSTIGVYWLQEVLVCEKLSYHHEGRHSPELA